MHVLCCHDTRCMKDSTVLSTWPGNSVLAAHTKHTVGHSIQWHWLRGSCNDTTANRYSSFNQSLSPFLWGSKPHLSGFWESPLVTYWFLGISTTHLLVSGNLHYSLSGFFESLLCGAHLYLLVWEKSLWYFMLAGQHNLLPAYII